MSVGGAGRAPVTGWLSADQAAALRPDDALRQAPMILLPGQDARRVAAEEAWGRAAMGALTADPQVAVTLAHTLGATSDTPHPPALALALPDDALADLPWELLCESASGSSLERGGQAVVVRLVPQLQRRQPAPPAGGRLRLLTWAPDPDDDAVASILAATHARFEAGDATVRLPADLSAPPPGPTPPPRLPRQPRPDRLPTGRRDTTAGDAAALLLPLLRRSALVLDICHGGMATTGAEGGLGQRLVAAGAQACVAAATTVGVDAAAGFAAGCLDALQTGAPLHAAVAEGRRRVGAQGTDHPDARWHNHRMLVASTQVLVQSPVQVAGWRPPGFPADCPEADPLWDAIRGHAESWGFVGLESVVAGLFSGDLPPRRSAAAAAQVAAHRESLESRPARRAPDAPDGLTVTPRLAAFGAQLPAGLSLSELVQPGAPRRQALGPPLPLPVRDPGDTLVLEVVAGPRTAAASPCAPAIPGRWSPPSPALRPAPADRRFDPALSRSGVPRAGPGGAVTPARGPVAVPRRRRRPRPRPRDPRLGPHPR